MKLKHLFLILILCIGAALSAVTFAQDAPEATAEATVEAPPPADPPVEVTAEPTAVPPTEEPPVEVTAEPTIEPTIEPTVEATLEPTAESTDEVPPEVTAEPTDVVSTPEVIAPEPAIALLFADNFESGDYTPWVGGAGWVALPGQMQAIDSNEPLTLVKGIYFNAVAMARTQFTSGSAQVSVRSSSALGYTAAVDTAGNVTLSRAGAPVGTAVVALTNAWTDIRLSAIGSVVRVAVNGVEVIVWNDEAPLPPGSVTISANFAPRTDPAAPSDTLTVEDFALFVPVEELPPPTEEPTVETPVVEVTAEPTVEVTVESTEVPVAEATAEPTEEVVTGSDVLAAIGVPTLKAPADLGFVNTPRPTLSWFAVTGANRYRVDINTNDTFTGTAILTDKEVGGLSLALSAANLPVALTQTKYFWRVQGRETGTNIWGGESDVWEFTVDLAKTPAEGAIITTATTARPAFVWTAASLAGATYVVQVDDNADFSSPIYTQTPAIGGTTHTIPVANALAWGNYYWRVVVNGETLNSALNIGNSFTVSPAAATAKLIAPANNLVTYDNTWGFDWDPTTATAGGPFEYQIQINNVNNFTGAVLFDQTAAATDFDAGTLADGAYWWRVRPVNTFGVGKWSSVWKFTVDTTAKPKAPLACTTNRRPTFSWDAVPGATQYNLLVDNNNDFSSPEINVLRSKTQLTYATPAASILAYNIYYWRVDFSFTPNSPFTFVTSTAVEDFCVTPTPLKFPTLVSPVNNSSINDTSLPNLTWNAVVDGANDVDYHIQVATNVNFPANSIIIDQIVEDTSFDDATARANGNYWWRVKSVNTLGAESTAWSPKWKFTLDTVAPAAPPNPTAPSCGSITTNNRPTFSWSAVTGAVKYQIQVDTHNPPTSLLIVTTGRTYQPPAQLLYTTWHWRVRALDAANNASAWSTLCNVIVNSANGIAPVPNRFTDSTPTLTWTPISWADSYTLEIYKSSTVSAANLVYTNSSILGTATSHDVSLPLDNGTYYWRVRAVDGTGPSAVNGNWSGPGLGIFQVEAP